jgi:hypothetical protein
MTAAIALPATQATAPGLVTRTTVAAAAAVGLTLAGVVIAPLVVLVVAVMTLALLGMVKVGSELGRTFEAMIAIGS